MTRAAVCPPSRGSQVGSRRQHERWRVTVMELGTSSLPQPHGPVPGEDGSVAFAEEQSMAEQWCRGQNCRGDKAAPKPAPPACSGGLCRGPVLTGRGSRAVAFPATRRGWRGRWVAGSCRRGGRRAEVGTQGHWSGRGCGVWLDGPRGGPSVRTAQAAYEAAVRTACGGCRGSPTYGRHPKRFTDPAPQRPGPDLEGQRLRGTRSPPGRLRCPPQRPCCRSRRRVVRTDSGPFSRYFPSALVGPGCGALGQAVPVELLTLLPLTP